MEILDLCVAALQQPLELKVRLHLVEENHLAVHVLPGRVEEVSKEPTDAAVGDVPAHHDKLLLRVGLQ